MTSPSTQPPLTEPSKIPSLRITRWDPARRGPDPQVSITVARATSSEEPTSELQSLLRISYAVICLEKINSIQTHSRPPITPIARDHISIPATNACPPYRS